MAALYEIDERLSDLIENGFHLDEETGEIWFASEDLEAVRAEKRDKLEACGLYIKNQLALADAIKTEEAELRKRRNAITSKVEHLKEYVARSLDDTMETPRVRLGIRRSTRLEITDEASVPSEYMRVRNVVSYDKNAMTSAIKQGAEIPGACLVCSKNLLVK